MGQPDPSWMTLGDEDLPEFTDIFDYDYEDDGLFLPDVEEC